MAEGIEEADNSNSSAGDATTSMLSAAMPCEMREFESYHHQAFSNTNATTLKISSTPKIMPLTQHNIRKMHKQSPSAHRQQPEKTQQNEDDQLSHSSCSSLAPLSPPQQQPINLKSEEFDDDYDVKSHAFVKCESMSPLRLMDTEQETNQRICTDDQAKAYNSDCNEIIDESVAIKEMARDDANSNILKRISEQQTQDVTSLLNSQSALVAAAAFSASTDRITPELQDAHVKLSSAMQKMLNFQNLQNLASIQQQKLSLVGLAAASCLNSPLNLSLGPSSSSSSSHIESGQMNANCSTSIANELANSLCGTTNETFPSQMPQLILASGQLMQGVQVAQLLIPSAQGISTQTILTIPVSQQVNSNEQLAQTLAALNNQQIHLHQKQQSTSHQMPNILTSSSLLSQTPQNQQKQQQQPGAMNTNPFASSVQQLLAAIQPTLFNLHEEQTSNHQRHRSLSTSSPSPNFMLSCSSDNTNIRVHTPKHSPIRKSHFEKSPHQQLMTQATLSTQSAGNSSTQLQNQAMASPSPLSQYTPNGERQTTSPHRISSPTQSQLQECNEQGQSAITSYACGNNNDNNNNNNADRAISSCSGNGSSGNSVSRIREQSPNIAMNNISRLTTANGELTITKSQGLPPTSNLTNSKSLHSHHLQSHRALSHHKNHHSYHQSSTSSATVTPTASMAATTDDEQTNEPTINQTTCNVVDGIDLDEIKEFAKAFKLRRLSLGLTQTQVGQALSVTEGPAYSQSAICSALAAQMYAAQLSSQQQQNMFEKLDITPKSAQKIKPVLERWMKEAEESRHWSHYKGGQNQLTDFIGVEPSKKRKRRTSFTPQALELLNAHFERNTHPSGTEITGLAHQLGYEREVIRIWFCNKRQALKNTVRMMSKGMV